jgi:aminoglycoside phosphotransferase family enzyme
MRRFDDGAVLSNDPSRVDGALAERLGRMIAGFHAKAPLRPQGGHAALAWTIKSNAHLLHDLKGRLAHERVEALVSATQAEYDRQLPLLKVRTASGFARRCHGDLHLANILVEHGEPVLFDCRVERAENCFPMIPSGKAHNEMILGDVAAAVDIGSIIDDAGKQLV